MRGGAEAFPQGQTYHRRPGAAPRRHSGAIRSGGGSRPLRRAGPGGQTPKFPGRTSSTSWRWLAPADQRSAGFQLQLAPLPLLRSIPGQHQLWNICQNQRTVEDRGSVRTLDPVPFHGQSCGIPFKAGPAGARGTGFQALPRRGLRGSRPQVAAVVKAVWCRQRRIDPQPIARDGRQADRLHRDRARRGFSPWASASGPCRARNLHQAGLQS